MVAIGSGPDAAPTDTATITNKGAVGDGTPVVVGLVGALSGSGVAAVPSAFEVVITTTPTTSIEVMQTGSGGRIA